MRNYTLKTGTRQKLFFDKIPSGSGLAFHNGAYYLMGDDAPFLYQLNSSFELVQRHALFDTTDFASGRIPKHLKPDLECMGQFTYGRDTYLLLMGSGASAARNKGFLVNLSEGMQVKEVDLSRFYFFLRSILGLQQEGLLNLEALAIDQTYAYLLQRSLGAHGNVLFRFDTKAMVDFLLQDGPLPVAAVYYFALPQLEGVHAGFSGADVVAGKLFFTASLEATTDAIADGQVLGSYIGMIDLAALPYATDPVRPAQVPLVPLLDPDGSHYLGKAESLVVQPVAEEGKYHVVVIADDDQGHSELLELLLQVEEK